MTRRIVIAGTGSSVGKTTLTIGLMAALQRKGYMVQGFKCGPDYIDPTYHTSVTGRQSRNVDSWMFSHEAVCEIFAHGSEGADISIVEGVMGLFDGKSPLSNTGSTAEISQILQAPVLLVVNCQSMARSAAAVVKGFQCFSEDVRIVGVIANKVGSEGHYKLVKDAVEQECGIPVIGYMLRESGIKVPERHLGLIPSIERGELAPMFQQLAEIVEANIDIDQLMTLAECPPLSEVPNQLFVQRTTQHRATIAIAKDAAFHFYYPENIELLEAYGARCVYFSPLAGETIPAEADGLYIGGGFPEEFALQLAEQDQVKASVRSHITAGMPTLAECGGYMYLTEQIVDTDGQSYPMVGIIPGQVMMQKKLAALGYREANGTEGNFLLGPQDQAKGHEFHYSTYQAPDTAESDAIPYAYETKGMRGTKKEGMVYKQLVAGYTHLHFASNPDVAERFVEACAAYHSSKERTT
ncbi:cobyrinic acid a,c-diamide synthase [Paenibacillus selenitireducens]|uniref:Cobyrinate a,c-diamide synthase n=1 Tax=Paenibacillus selenitireducens TaxID=1324314 RepID=A0A1T2XD00_9BACL|nr:cobyrinate a,c-diamide synthase [Paenibacillus selenitireducens]OPA77715.1 cobyrinic acid a,c-diamide synthase [Paenibacillus selenitireducens]